MQGLRTDVIALAALGLVAAVGIGALVLRGSTAGTNPLAAVPANSFLVVSVDLAPLAQSPLGEALLDELKSDAGARAEALLGVDSIQVTCGFDPLPHLRMIALAVPESESGGERGDFGVAASGTLSKDVLLTCAKAVIAKRGGAPTTRQTGSFVVVSDAHASGGAEVAFRDGGPYLVGRGAWLARMIDAAEGRVPSVLASSGAAHAQLRAELATRDTDAEAVIATAVLPRDLRQRLQREVAPEPESRAPNAAGKENKAWEGILGVSAAAAGLHAGRAHEDARLVAELRCDTESECAAVSTFILHTRLLWSGNLGYRLFGLGPLIDNLEVHPDAARTSLYIGTHAPVDDLAKILGRVLSMNPGKKPRPPQPAILAPVADGGP